MFKVVKKHCQFESEESAKAHIKILSKSSRVIDSGYDHNEKLGHHSWWTSEEWVDNKEVIENDFN